MSFKFIVTKAIVWSKITTHNIIPEKCKECDDTGWILHYDMVARWIECPNCQNPFDLKHS